MSESNPNVRWWEQPFYSGKVRDLYRAASGELVMVATDRLSAFDVVMAEPVPGKGRVLTAMSDFWFRRFGDTVASALISTDPTTLIDDPPEPFFGRTMVCRPADMLPIEVIVRGYITGSAWREYRRAGTIHSEPAPAGLIEADRLPEPIVTPSTKATTGHDENISRAAAASIIGSTRFAEVERVALELYATGAAVAAEAGIIVADTKFEFGLIDSTLVLCDEVLTPDSSRLWDVNDWQPGATPDSFDKQPVRDFLDSLDWDHQPPPPALPAAIIEQTVSRYRAVYERVTGLSLDSWPGT